MINIIIADDHAIFRHGLRSLLAGESDFRVLAESDNGTKALQDIIDLRPHVAVLDLSMPYKNGIEIIAEVLHRKLSTRCILLTMHDDTEIASSAIQNGAAGYLLKNQTFQEINQAIRTVASGKNYISQELMHNMMEQRMRPHDKSMQLTRREQEVLQLVVKGLPSIKIATQLGISERTVETHKHHIMGKLNIHSTPEIITYVLKHKLVSIE